MIRTYDFYQQRVRPIPSDITGTFAIWLRQLADAVNSIPPTSSFSYATPESNVTAMPGTWGYNVASGVSAVWFKQSGTSNTGWKAVA